MTDQHPITPPEELVQQLWSQCPAESDNLLNQFATLMARWGADQELEACCAWLQDPDLNVDTYKLRAARRPKPPSLAEQALQALHQAWRGLSTHADWQLIRHALERLKELEKGNE